MKTCSKCRLEKPLSEFHKRTSASDGLQRWCKTCNLASSNDWSRRNPQNRRDNTRRVKYGIGPDRFAEMIAAQNGRCAICSKEFLETPHIDHDHACCAGVNTCGKCVRGLLCRLCNHQLGIYELISNTPAAMNYLKTYQSPFV